jgi:hypothetical protein
VVALRSAIASRRKAVKLITDASELLDQPPPQAGSDPSIDRDPEVLPDSSEAP